MINNNEIKVLRKLAKGQENKFQAYVKRKKTFEPLSYITGKIEFYNLDFFIDRRAYVPNSETQMLANYGIEYFKNKTKIEPLIIDVGTGCGNIAIVLAKEFPRAKIIATDILPGSLELAKKNASFHSCKRIKFIETNLVCGILCKDPDLIISDLPYGSQKYTLKSIDIRELRHMPVISTFTTGLLDSYLELIDQLLQKKWKSVLLIETGILPEKVIKKNMPKGIRWKYIQLEKNYSITRVDFY